MITIFPFFCSVLLVAGLLAGCGDDDDGTYPGGDGGPPGNGDLARCELPEVDEPAQGPELDPSEFNATDFMGDPVDFDRYEIVSAEDAAHIENIEAIPGELLVHSGFLEEGERQIDCLELPALASLEDRLTIRENEPPIGTDEDQWGAIPEEITFAGLHTAEDGFRVMEVSERLTHVSAPALTEAFVGGNITQVGIEGNATLEEVDFSSLERARHLVVTDNLALHVLEVGSLEEVYSQVEITGNAALTTLDLSGLNNAGRGTPVMFEDNPALEELDLSNLETVHQDLIIEDNPQLSTLELSSLSSVTTDLTIRDNPELPSCDAEAIANQADVMGDVVICGNGEDSCYQAC